MSPVLASFGGGSARGFGRAFRQIVPIPPTNFTVTQSNTSNVGFDLSWTNTNPSAQIQLIADTPFGLQFYTLNANTTNYFFSAQPDTYYGFAVRYLNISGTQTNYTYLYSRPKTIKFYFIQSATPSQTDRLYMYWGIQWPEINNSSSQNHTINIYRDGVNIANYGYSSYTYDLTNLGLSAGTVYTYGIQITNNVTGVSSYRTLQQAKTRPTTGIITTVGWNSGYSNPVTLPMDSCYVNSYAWVNTLTNVPANWEIRATTYNSSTRDVIASTIIPKIITPNIGSYVETYAGMCKYEGCGNDFSGIYEIAVFNEYGTKMTYGIEQGGSNGSPYDFYYGC